MGTLYAGQKVTVAYRAEALATGEVFACKALASTGLTLTVDVGNTACSVANTLPETLDPVPPGSPPAAALDVESLRDAAKAMGGTLNVTTSDKADIEALVNRIERSISHAPAGESQQWQDEGYYLLFILAFIMLTFFRKGGSVAIE